MSYLDALTRIGAIEAQLTSLVEGPAAAEAQQQQPQAGTGATDFAAALAQAQAGAPATAALGASAADGAAGATGTLPAAGAYGDVPTASPYGSIPTNAGAYGGMPTTAGAYSAVPTTGAYGGMSTAGAYGGVSMAGMTPQSVSLGNAPLTASQRTFAQRLAADTGLDPHVIAAWLLAEESGGAAASRDAQGNNDWLNIGYTDSGTYGAGAAVWTNPVSAADATAGWLAGRDTIPGYGTASAGVQGILRTAGMAPQAQIAAIQGSGWASSGYPDLPALYAQVSG